MMPCKFCTDPDGQPCYPQYGLAPHLSPSSLRKVTEFLPRDSWPPNFVPDPESDNHGTWFCPMCGHGDPSVKGQ